MGTTVIKILKLVLEVSISERFTGFQLSVLRLGFKIDHSYLPLIILAACISIILAKQRSDVNFFSLNLFINMLVGKNTHMLVK